MLVGNFLKLNMITGTNIISTIFRGAVNIPVFLFNLPMKLTGSKYRLEPGSKIFRYKFKFNFQPFELLKKRLLLT